MKEKNIKEYQNIKLKVPNSKFQILKSNYKGITLIALVVTIIVLLILAGVTINIVLSEGGLFSRATEASDNQKMAEIRDQVVVLLSDYQVDKYESRKDLETYLNEQVTKNAIDSVEESGTNYIVSLDGYNVTINGTTLGIESIVKDGATGGSGSGGNTGGGQTPSPEPTDVAVTSITINKTETTINVGATETLSITSVEPSNATDQTVTWSSNATAVAEVNETTGVVTAKQAGTAIITATANGGENVTASCTVTVEPVTVVANMTATDKNIYAQDKYGNPIVIPAGFTVVAHGTDYVEYTYDKENGTSTNTPVVQDGIVIKHSTDGNQFVWVPIGEIKNDAVENTSNKTNIKLGRYENFGTGANATPVQEARKNMPDNEPPALITVDSYTAFEISSNFPGVTYNNVTYSAASGYGNTKATNLTEWINGAIDNEGYYIARYEASYDGAGNKALSQQSLSASTSAPSARGALWNNVTQLKAAEASKAMYVRTEGSLFYSDLINSYAWDTALIFIQAYSGKNTYAAQDSQNSGSLAISGERDSGKDKVCNIYDMASNVQELSTETSSAPNSPAITRGSGYVFAGYSLYHSSSRLITSLTIGAQVLGFRPALYCSPES